MSEAAGLKLEKSIHKTSRSMESEYEKMKVTVLALERMKQEESLCPSEAAVPSSSMTACASGRGGSRRLEIIVPGLMPEPGAPSEGFCFILSAWSVRILALI